MRILSIIRQVLDAEESVKVIGGAVSLSGSKLVIDTMDEYGIEEALRLREATLAPKSWPSQSVQRAARKRYAEL